MTTAELVNLIVRKFGGNRVTFLRLYDYQLTFKWGANVYLAICCRDNEKIVVRRMDHNSTLFSTQDTYSGHVEGILNGMVRNEQGEMVQP